MSFRMLSLGVLLILTPCVHTAAEDAIIVTGPRPSASPLSWTHVRDASDEEIAMLRELVNRWGGARFGEPPIQVPELVDLTDEMPFGENMTSRRAWQVGVPMRITKHEGTDEAVVDVTLVMDENDGRLLLAYTKPSETWVLPDPNFVERDSSANPRGPQGAEPLETAEVKSNVREILGVVWQFGTDPSKAGQVILRPRKLLSTWPPVERDGSFFPNEKPATFWITHVRGIVVDVFEEGEVPRYMSSKIIMIRDDDVRVTISSLCP